MYRLNEAQQRIAATAAAIAEKDLAPRAAAVDRDAAFPTEASPRWAPAVCLD
jgi:alkylation response protein AidB-like acyl-CoA dehydrogenase